MSREAYINQTVDGAVRPAGRVANWVPLFAWGKSLPRRAYPAVAALLKDGVAGRLAALEAELLQAFLTHEPGDDQRPEVEALLLAVLGRDPDADALGFADYLPLPAGVNGHDDTPVTILERAVKVGERTWQEWPEARRRREYLLLEFFDAVRSDAGAAGRNERLAASLRLLAEDRAGA
jgi:hypothetical protein